MGIREIFERKNKKTSVEIEDDLMVVNDSRCYSTYEQLSRREKRLVTMMNRFVDVNKRLHLFVHRSCCLENDRCQIESNKTSCISKAMFS
jgi:uncharacterized protein YktB (UPF0637 family)